MEAERLAELKRAAPKLFTTLLVVESFTLPIFRSGGRTDLTFWGWIVNHTIFGPPVEYVPEEDYARELEGAISGYPVLERVQTFRTTEEAMAFFKTNASSVDQMVKDGAISIIAGNAELRLYEDLMADVRGDHKLHSIRSLVQPDDPEVRDVARELSRARDFISAAREFVNSFTTYGTEVGDYWSVPAETLVRRSGDCDCLSILLCSILRNQIPAENVYCAIGKWSTAGKTEGHMWVVVAAQNGEDRILESTAGPDKPDRGKYVLYGMFNDRYAFSTDMGIKEFELRPVQPSLIGAGKERVVELALE